MTMLPPHLSNPSNNLVFYAPPTPCCFSPISSSSHLLLMASPPSLPEHHHPYTFSTSNNIHNHPADPPTHNHNPNSSIDPDINNNNNTSLLLLGSGLSDPMVDEQHSRSSNSMNETQAEMGPSECHNHEHEGSSWLQIGLTASKDDDHQDPSEATRMGEMGLGRGSGSSNSDGLMLELNLGGGSRCSSIPHESQVDEQEYSYYGHQPPTANLTTSSLIGGVSFLPSSATPYGFQQGEYGWGLIRALHSHPQYYIPQQRPSSSFLAGSSVSPSASSSSASFLGRGFSGPTTNIRVMDPPPRRPHSGIWFMLQASQHQGREPYLAQVSKSFLRIKDGRTTVGLVMKYLANKLGLDSESEVEVRCRGQELVPLLTLEHVRDNIWSSGEVVNLHPDSSTSHHVMLLHYARTTTSS